MDLEDIFFSELPYKIALGILIAKYFPVFCKYLKNIFIKHKDNITHRKILKIVIILFILFNLFAFIEGIRQGINRRIKNEEATNKYNNCLKNEKNKRCTNKDFCFIEVCEKPFLLRVNYFKPLQRIYNIR